MDVEFFKAVIASGYANLENNKQRVNDLNVFPVPDGDTGTNMSLTMQFAVKELEKSGAENIGDVATACSSGALMGARGNSGVILSQLLRGFSKECLGKKTIDIAQTAQAMVSASKMAYKAVMKPTEGTILTVAREMAEFAEAHAKEYTDGVSFFSAVIEKGKEALAKTPELLPVLKEAGVVDSGGTGLIYVCEGILEAMKGTPVKINSSNSNEKAAAFNEDVNSEITFSYCTEFLVRTDGKASYKKYVVENLMKIGDSLVVIEDENIVKIHVHTNEPWNAMKIVSVCGAFVKVKIENMREQHSELFKETELGSEHEVELESKEAVYSDAHVPYAIISVSAGDGLSSILKDLGVTYIVEGGQTMNPSTQDFMEIINNTNADNYIILPNNKNIILAAQQTKDMCEKNIAVLETKTIPEAIGAMIEFNETASLEDNINAMKAAMEGVVSGQLTYAVRNTVVNGKEISEGDVIGIVASDIVVCQKDIQGAAIELVEKMTDDDTEIVSIYYGSDVSEQTAENLREKLSEKFPEVDIEVYYGGQPLYYYIVSAE